MYLSIRTAHFFVCAFVLSQLDYCNSLLSGCSLYLINKHQNLGAIFQAGISVQTLASFPFLESGRKPFVNACSPNRHQLVGTPSLHRSSTSRDSFHLNLPFRHLSSFKHKFQSGYSYISFTAFTLFTCCETSTVRVASYVNGLVIKTLH